MPGQSNQREALKVALEALYWDETQMSSDRQSMSKDDWKEVYGDRYTRVTKSIRVIEDMLRTGQLTLPL